MASPPHAQHRRTHGRSSPLSAPPHRESLDAAGDDLREFVEAGGEPLDDLEQFVGLEVVGRRLAARSPFAPKLPIEVLEELGGRPNLATFGSHPR